MKGEKHAGRTKPEKAQRILRDPEYTRAQADRRAEEEAQWAARNGPVTVRRRDDAAR